MSLRNSMRSLSSRNPGSLASTRLGYAALTASRVCSVVTRRYISVVWTDTCPRKSRTLITSTPESSR